LQFQSKGVKANHYSSLTNHICVALAATQSHRKKPAEFSKAFAETKVKARPSGRRLVLFLQGALAGCLLGERRVCAFQFFWGSNSAKKKMRVQISHRTTT
jgi:hypothetical protein